MAENPAHFVGEALFRPIGMLAAQARRLHFARRPVEPLGQTQPSRASHRAQRGELFGTGLLIWQHKPIMRQGNGSCKRGAFTSGVAAGEAAILPSSPAIIAALGTPIKDGFFVNGSISENDDSGSAYFMIPITGPKGTAMVNVSATKSLGKWHFVDLVVQVDRTQEQINLLETNQLPVAMPPAAPPPAKTP